MVFYSKQSHGQGRRIYPGGSESNSGARRRARRVDLNLSDYWEGMRVNHAPARVSRIIIEDFTVPIEEVPQTRPLGESERDFKPSIRVLQEGRDFRKRRYPASWARQANRLGNHQSRFGRWNAGGGNRR